jgi:hypothetical protein
LEIDPLYFELPLAAAKYMTQPLFFLPGVPLRPRNLYCKYSLNIAPPTLSIRKESIYGLEKRELKIFKHEELHDNILTKLEVKGRVLFYSEKIYIPYSTAIMIVVYHIIASIG